ncbi:type VI secretion system-associated protein TagF [Viridibacterium curvum]|uniref:Type VI secretion system-associated protein TagF n=1 Tax=Viridibacterium curvum TaxID=1101404 RepID=A0ABP9QV67_9RHOO
MGTAAPGWYGKLPSLGDFASRRLSSSFIQDWDGWLQRSISSSRTILGEQWLNTYLTSSIWHFLLGPGVVGDKAWAGVLLPSVDRVGRYFPLTVAADFAADALPDPGDANWSGALESAVRVGLDANAGVDAFDNTLQRITVGRTLSREAVLQAAQADDETRPFPKPGSLLQAHPTERFVMNPKGHSLWLCGRTSGEGSGFVSRGLPTIDLFVRMLEHNPDGE